MPKAIPTVTYLRMRVANGCRCGGTLELCATKKGFGYSECVNCRAASATITFRDLNKFLSKLSMSK